MILVEWPLRGPFAFRVGGARRGGRGGGTSGRCRAVEEQLVGGAWSRPGVARRGAGVVVVVEMGSRQSRWGRVGVCGQPADGSGGIRRYSGDAAQMLISGVGVVVMVLADGAAGGDRRAGGGSCRDGNAAQVRAGRASGRARTRPGGHGRGREEGSVGGQRWAGGVQVASRAIPGARRGVLGLTEEAVSRWRRGLA